MASFLLVSPSARHTSSRRKHRMRSLLGFLVLASSIATYLYLSSQLGFEGPQPEVLPLDANSILANCRSLSLRPGPPVDFHAREQSDRFQPGTTPVVIRNATIWTGEGDGLQTLRGDVLLDKGIIKFMGNIPAYTLASYGSDIHVIEAHGYVTTFNPCITSADPRKGRGLRQGLSAFK